jgi:hypothetical protein
VFVDCSKEVAHLDGNVKKLLDKFEMQNNLAVNTRGTSQGIAMTNDLKGFSNLSGTPDKPIPLGLTENSQGKWELHQDPSLLTKEIGFEPIPFDKIGLYLDDFRRKLPE